jgi:hypothetical protein
MRDIVLSYFGKGVMMMRKQFFLFLLFSLCATSCLGLFSSSGSDEEGCQPDDLDCLVENLEFLAGNKNPDDGSTTDHGGVAVADDSYIIEDTAYDNDYLEVDCGSGYQISSLDLVYQSDDCADPINECDFLLQCLYQQTCEGKVDSTTCGNDPCPGFDKYLFYRIECTIVETADTPFYDDDDDDTGYDDDDDSGIGDEEIENLISDTIDTLIRDSSDLPRSNSNSNEAPQIKSCTSSITLELDYIDRLEIEYEDPFGCQPSFGVRLCKQNCYGSDCCSSKTKFTPPIPDNMISGTWRTYTYLAEQVTDTAELTMQVFPISIDGCDYYELEAIGEILEGEPDKLAVGDPCEIDLTIEYIYYPPYQEWLDYCEDTGAFSECVSQIGDEYYFGDDDDDDNDDYEGPGTIVEETCVPSVTCEVCSIDACTRAIISSSSCTVEAWYNTSDGLTFPCGELTCEEATQMNEYCLSAAQAAVAHCCPPDN